MVQPAAARPRSWFLPPLEVSCQNGDGKPEVFTGEFELNGAVAFRDELFVGGTLVGSCGPVAIDSSFRAPVSVDATCEEASLVIADSRVGPATINFSEQPIVITDDEVGKGAMCALAGAQNGSLKAQAKALSRVLALSA